MKNKTKSTKKIVFNSAMRIAIFVVAIIVFGISTSYAYYVANIKGQAVVDESKTATLNISTTLESSPAISASKMSIIDASDYLTKGQKVDFNVTNETTSNVKAKYTLKLVDMSITKNLSSKYFKYAIIINAGTDKEKRKVFLLLCESGHAYAVPQCYEKICSPVGNNRSGSMVFIQPPVFFCKKFKNSIDCSFDW